MLAASKNVLYLSRAQIGPVIVLPTSFSYNAIDLCSMSRTPMNVALGSQPQNGNSEVLFGEIMLQ